MKQEAASDKAEMAKQSAQYQANRMVSTIDSAIEKVGKSTTGIGGKMFRYIPGSSATDLESDLDTIKANLGFAELQAMRASSPTGGALGAVSERELTALQSTVASLKQEQSSDQLRRNLEAIKNHYDRWAKTVAGVNPDEPSGQGGGKKASAAERYNQLKAGGMAEADIYKKMAKEGY